MISASYKLCRCPVCGMIWAICSDPNYKDSWYYHDARYLLTDHDSNAKISGTIHGDSDFFCVNDGATLEFMYEATQSKSGHWLHVNIPTERAVLLS